MGRQPEFDRDQVLSTATDLFWEVGYRGASVSDLVQATGLQPGSIYAAFGNKEGLFIACLQFYGEAALCHLPPESGPKSPLERLEAMLMSIVEESASDPRRRGCFVLNSLLEIAPQVPAVQSEVREILERNESWMRDRLMEAVEAGEIDREIDAEDTAACLMGVIATSRLMSRAQQPEDRIKKVARKMIRSLIGPYQLAATV
jgi:TetR/AcrR family transcriptional repressor of nem operon